MKKINKRNGYYIIYLRFFFSSYIIFRSCSNIEQININKRLGTCSEILKNICLFIKLKIDRNRIIILFRTLHIHIYIFFLSLNNIFYSENVRNKNIFVSYFVQMLFQTVSKIPTWTIFLLLIADAFGL